MSDWAEDAMLKAFPRAGNTYFLQLVDEPVVKTIKGQYGPYTSLSVGLQLFGQDEAGDYHYVGPVQFKGQSCVFEDFAAYAHMLLDVCYEVEGFKHGKHVDLEIKETFDRQYPGRTLEPQPTQPPTGPPKPAAAAVVLTEQDVSSERGQPGAGEATGDSTTSPYGQDDPASPANPCLHDKGTYFVESSGSMEKGFYCKACGERVG